MPIQSANLKMPYLVPSQAQKHITHNDALQNLDTNVQLSVLDRTLTVPPASPSEGDRYIPAPSSTAGWSGKDGQIAAFQNEAWEFYLPKAGWRCWDQNAHTLLVHTGSIWEIFSFGGGRGGTNTKFIPVWRNKSIPLA